MSEPKVETIFCDDIREEVGNKRSLMGIYHGEMFVQSFPVLLPRLCFYITFLTEIDSVTEKFEIKVLKGTGEEIISTGLVEFPDQQLNPDNLGVPYSKRTFVLAFGVSPFSLESETVIRVEAQMGDIKIFGPCLRIRSAESQPTVVSS